MILLMQVTGSVFNRRTSAISASEVRKHVAAAAYLSNSIETVMDLIQIGRVLAIRHSESGGEQERKQGQGLWGPHSGNRDLNRKEHLSV